MERKAVAIPVRFVRTGSETIPVEILAMPFIY